MEWEETIPERKHISTIIHYSSLDRRFLRRTIEQCAKFSSEIIVTYYKRFWNSLALDPLYLEDFEDFKHYTINDTEEPYIKFVEIEMDSPPLSNQQYYMIKARFFGQQHAKHDYLLFLDADEIPEGDLFLDWLQNYWYGSDPDGIYQFTCNWYFRQPIYRLNRYDSCGLLAPKIACVWDMNSSEDRQQILNSRANQNTRNIYWGGSEQQRVMWKGLPMFHHYSWVRTKEELLLKTANWGHRNDRNWAESIFTEFETNFKLKDTIFNNDYVVVPDSFRLGLF